MITRKKKNANQALHWCIEMGLRQNVSWSSNMVAQSAVAMLLCLLIKRCHVLMR